MRNRDRKCSGALTGIPQSTLSAIENDRVKLGLERAKVIARALECHPSVLVFPNWDVAKESAACLWPRLRPQGASAGGCPVVIVARRRER